MYYPYFRGKQFDLIALRTLIEEGRLSKKICPLIEPVKDSSAFEKFTRVVKACQHPVRIIENPQAGEFVTQEGLQKIRQLVLPTARILDEPLETLDETPQMLVLQQSSAALSSDWKENKCPVVLTEEFRLLRKVRGPKILLEDAFTRLPKVSFYQECPDELFSTAHLYYQSKGFSGFSNFSIDSKIYYDRGYPASQLSIHLVYFDDWKRLRIHHFLSPEDLATQKEKFLKMMADVNDWSQGFFEDQRTSGLTLLIDCFEQGKFPGMGIMRKATVMHHLELMSRYLDQHS